MADITYQDKEDRTSNPLTPKYKWVAADANAVKTAINAINAVLRDCVRVIPKQYPSSAFSANTITVTETVGLTADLGFFVYSDSGAGGLLKSGAAEDGGSYTHNTSTGVITMSPENIRIVIYKPITI